MLRAIIASFVCLVFLSSCRKPMAQFQKSSYENFEISGKEIKKSKKEILETTNDLIINTVNSETNIDYYEDTIEIIEETSIIINSSKTKTSDFTYINSESKLETKEVSNSLDKKKKKKNLFFNDNIKIGAIFLGIAIGLSFFGLTQLTLIFGLASLVFIYLGLKKYYRRKRIRNFFNRKK